MMNVARHAVGLEGLALTERAYQLALNFARERVQGEPLGMRGRKGATIIEHADVRRMLLLMKSQAEAMRALAYVCADIFDIAEKSSDPEIARTASRRGDFLTPIVKGWCTETGIEMASLGIQVHGGMGFIEETGAAQYLRDARITTIYEGTTGIQAADLVSRKTLRDGGVAALDLLEEIEAVAASLSVEDPRLEEIGVNLAQAVVDVRVVLEWMLQVQTEDVRLPAAASVHYLHLWGITCGGWLMAKAAQLCNDKLIVGEGDSVFCETKIATAHFYSNQVMPQTSTLARIIVRGSGSVLDLDKANF
tara:strand:- start:390 stop:1307 length:918 start_codon:yes stop_codon:yes gene_type:complete